GELFVLYIMESNKNRLQIISVEKNNGKSELILNSQKFTQLCEGIRDNFIILGVIGKQRVGKSSADNNLITELTGVNNRPFSEEDSAETDTRGIHVYVVKFNEMNKNSQTIILDVYKHEIDIMLLDCEGTESADNEGTSKLYLLTFILSSCIHIHVPKAL